MSISGEAGGKSADLKISQVVQSFNLCFHRIQGKGTGKHSGNCCNEKGAAYCEYSGQNAGGEGLETVETNRTAGYEHKADDGRFDHSPYL